MTAPKPPLCKGRWHGEAVTKGLCSTQRQIGMQQCASVKSTRIAVGEGFYPSRRYNVVNSLAPTQIRMRRNVYVFDGASRAGGVEPRPYADLVDSTRSPMVHTILLLPAAQSLSRLRRQLPLHKGAFGACRSALVHLNPQYCPAPMLRRNTLTCSSGTRGRGVRL